MFLFIVCITFSIFERYRVCYKGLANSIIVVSSAVIQPLVPLNYKTVSMSPNAAQTVDK